MLSAISPRNSLKFHVFFVAVAGFFCLFCLVLSALTPRPGFEVSVQTSGVVVKRVLGSESSLQVGDIIESVDGKNIHSRAGLNHALFLAGDTVEMTIRRTGSRFQRPVSASDFVGDTLPAGVRANDKPIFLTDESGEYTPLEGVDLGTLRGILEDEGRRVSVVFKRQEEVIDATVPLFSSSSRTFGASLVFLLIALMGVVAWKGRKRLPRGSALWGNLILGLGAISAMTLGMWTMLSSVPPLLVLGLFSITFFKACDLDYHVVFFGFNRRPELWTRIVIFAGPAATLLAPLWFSIESFPVLWGGDIAAEAEMRLDSCVFLPMLWAVAYTMIDGGLAIARRFRDPQRPLSPYEIGVWMSCVVSVFVFIYLRIDLMNAQWFLMAAVVIQSVAGAFSSFESESDMSRIRLNSPLFSTVPIRDAFDRAHRLFGNAYHVQVVIERPAPRHIVAVSRSDEESDFNGLALDIIPESWRDFLDVFHIEGSALTGESHDARDPVHGIAAKLGIAIALPMADNVAGTLTSLTFLVSVEQTSLQDVPSVVLSSSQREELTEILEEFVRCAPAFVYQSAEMSLECVGEDIDEFARHCHETASFARGIKNPTLPMDPRALPHGLLEEDEEPIENTELSEASTLVVDNPEKLDVTCDTRVYEEEVQFLRSQVAALYSQQIRGYALGEIELTEAQQAALDDIATLDPPMLFVGEPGTGKRLLALAAHQARSEGAFLTIDAAAIPESIFALDMFGDGQDPGLIANAANGSIFIQNADRIGETLLNDVLDVLQKLPSKQSVALYLSVNTTPESFNIEQYRRTPSTLPAEIQTLAAKLDAEIIALDPLRTQDDLDVVANFFRQKQVLCTNKTVDAFTSEALLALKSYSWPGNFTELRAVVDRAVLRCETHEITVADLGRDFVDLSDASTKNVALSETDVFREQVQLMQILNETQQAQIERMNDRIAQLELQLSEKRAPCEEDAFLEGTYADIEKRLLDRILDKYQRDPDAAADAMGVNHTRFFNKLAKYQLIRNG